MFIFEYYFLLVQIKENTNDPVIHEVSIVRVVFSPVVACDDTIDIFILKLKMPRQPYVFS